MKRKKLGTIRIKYSNGRRSKTKKKQRNGRGKRYKAHKSSMNPRRWMALQREMDWKWFRKHNGVEKVQKKRKMKGKVESCCTGRTYTNEENDRLEMKIQGRESGGKMQITQWGPIWYRNRGGDVAEEQHTKRWEWSLENNMQERERVGENCIIIKRWSTIWYRNKTRSKKRL